MPQRRFPFPAVPTGWYHVVHSADVPAGAVVPLRVLERDLVCFRGESGQVAATDAHCPHLGAHIGHGGFVDGDLVVCPFHEWRFDREGANVEIPYSSRTNQKARLGCWHTTEAYGHVFVWFDTQGGPPQWELPVLAEVDDPGYVRVEGARWIVDTHVQEVMENVVDIAHFQYVHGTGGFGDAVVEQDGPMFRSTVAVKFVTPRGHQAGSVVSELWGLGLDIVRPKGLLDAAVVFTTTPLDDGRVEMGYTFFLPRAADGDGPINAGRGLMDDFAKQGLQDTPIWEHKRYVATPALAADDGPILTFRRWATQFHGG